MKVIDIWLIKKNIKFAVSLSFILILQSCAMLTYQTKREIVLSSKVKELELLETRWYPMTPFSDNNSTIYLPFPFKYTAITKQTVYYNDAEVWLNEYDYDRCLKNGQDKMLFFVSPDETKMFVQDRHLGKQSQVVHFSPYKKIQIVIPSDIFKKNVYYRLEYVGWNSKSSMITTKSSYPYDAIWEVDAYTGLTKRVLMGVDNSDH